MSRVFIVGAGKLGMALGLGWREAGHDVRFGIRNPADARYAAIPADRIGPVNDRRGAEVVVCALPFDQVRPAILALGDLTDTILIDCTNPLRIGRDGLQLALGYETSGAELVASWAAGARVFKTLNQTGAENIVNARSYASEPVMFVAGDDADGKGVVMKLVSDLAFEAVDAGPLTAARLLEPLAMVWIELAIKRGRGRNFALALVSHAASSNHPLT